MIDWIIDNIICTKTFAVCFGMFIFLVAAISLYGHVRFVHECEQVKKGLAVRSHDGGQICIKKDAVL